MHMKEQIETALKEFRRFIEKAHKYFDLQELTPNNKTA